MSLATHVRILAAGSGEQCCGVSNLVVWETESSAAVGTASGPIGKSLARVDCSFQTGVYELLRLVSRSAGSSSCDGVVTLVVWAAGK